MTQKISTSKKLMVLSRDDIAHVSGGQRKAGETEASLRNLRWRRLRPPSCCIPPPPLDPILR
ncbi:MAG: hypothetical protein AAF749_06340 [Pseudomonadota bacterium]